MFGVSTKNQKASEAMVLIGLGLGLTMQTYTLIVQNSVERADMAVATSATQLSRSMGAAIGLAILGTILTQGMASPIARYLPPAVLHQLQPAGGPPTPTPLSAPPTLAP